MGDMSAARAALLRALDHLDRAEEELGLEPERCDLYVVYSVGADDGDAWRSMEGWASTAGPKWLHAALLRRAADALDNPVASLDDDAEDDDV